MAEKRILIVDSDLLARIEANRGDMSQADFIRFLIDTHLNGQDEIGSSKQYVERQEFEDFAQGMKELLRRFLDFFISYGMELGDEPKDSSFDELVKKLQSLSNAPPKSRPSK
jgi:hypothetical protein